MIWGRKKSNQSILNEEFLRNINTSIFIEKNVINSEYERLSKNSLTSVMKFILIEKALLATFVGKIKQEMFYWL